MTRYEKEKKSNVQGHLSEIRLHSFSKDTLSGGNK